MTWRFHCPRNFADFHNLIPSQAQCLVNFRLRRTIRAATFNPAGGSAGPSPPLLPQAAPPQSAATTQACAA